MKKLLFFYILLISIYSCKGIPETGIEHSKYAIEFTQKESTTWTFLDKISEIKQEITFPEIEIDGLKRVLSITDMKQNEAAELIDNGGLSYSFSGNISGLNGSSIALNIQTFPDNSVIRFQYKFKDDKGRKLTKSNGSDAIQYLSTAVGPDQKFTEVRLSEYNEMIHATHCTEVNIPFSFFENKLSAMGPILTSSNGSSSLLIAYEHGSQYPNRFMEYRFAPENSVSLNAVKANYLPGRSLDGFQTPWFELALVNGNSDVLAKEYRTFVLKYLAENTESRKPYIYYNTWGRQERTNWAGGTYNQTMNLAFTLAEIDRCHEMGVDIYVMDTGWYLKTGDWQVNTEAFPDGLKQIKAKLDAYNMKLGLWFNPCAAALSSNMLAKNQKNRMAWDGVPGGEFVVWETEKSVRLCLVSSYWEDFADELVRLVKETGVSYFKWDAIDQYGCNDPSHNHGDKTHTAAERSESYAFQLPGYMVKVVEHLKKECPDAIVDMDITEEGRSVGLEFLTVGKYFIINNGPYYHNFDLSEKWKSVLPNLNANIFVNSGPARGWFVRGVLDYDKWIPSTLFLTHYQPDDPRNSQLINVASLILGQNGIWGEVLKTSPEGVEFIGSILEKYKKISTEITNASMIRTGIPGGNPEIYEKIDPETGKGCLVIFATSPGEYSYVTTNKPNRISWQTEGVDLKTDSKGRAVVSVKFSGSSAKIILFGVN